MDEPMAHERAKGDVKEDKKEKTHKKGKKKMQTSDGFMFKK